MKSMAALTICLKQPLSFGAKNISAKSDIFYENNSGIEIYSTRYLSNDEIEKDAKEYNRILGRLGFKSVFYSLSPETTGLEYTFD